MAKPEMDMDLVCRTCLQQGDDMRSIFLKDDQACVCVMVSSCTQLKCKEGDGLPVHICQKCLERVTMAFTFKLQAERSDAVLRNYIAKKHINLDDQIKVEVCHDDENVEGSIKTEEKMIGDYTFDGPTDSDNFDTMDNQDDSDEDVKPLKDYISPKKSSPDKKIKKLVPCIYCNKTFLNSDTMKTHKQKYHQGYCQCDICLKVFTKVAIMEHHKISVHKISSVTLPEEDSNQYLPDHVACKFCNLTFLNEDDLISHTANSHNGHKKRGRPSKKDILRNKKRLKKILETMDIKSMDDETQYLVETPVEYFNSISNNTEEIIEENLEIFPESKLCEYCCNYCGKLFTSFSLYDKHVKKHLAQRSYICKLCDKNFDIIDKMKIHLRTHDNVESFASIRLSEKKSIFEKHSKLTGENLDNISEDSIIAIVIDDIKSEAFDMYYTEMKVDVDLDSDDDDEIDTESNKKSNIFIPKTKLYTKLYKIKKPHPCPVCKQLFSKTNHLMRHIETHEGYEFQDKCEICNKSFPTKASLLRHKKIHKPLKDCENTLKMYACDTCDMKFSYEMTLNKHILTQHKGKSVSVNFVNPAFQQKEKTFVCSNCNKAFYREEQLEKHKKIHLPNEKKFECTICQKKFNRKDNLRSHSRVHETNKDDLDSNCLCVYCGHSFSNSSNLIVHMRRHTGEKPYKCDICSKAFPRSSDLRCHRRTHTGEKPCLCTICGKGFSRSNKLVRHMRIHTGQRPYKCMFCERAFTQSNDLTLHVRRHTGDKPYVCGVCGDRFIQGTALQSHRKAQGHFEVEGQYAPAPISANSVNNPNRITAVKPVLPITTPPSLKIKIKEEGESSTSTSTAVTAATATTTPSKPPGKSALTTLLGSSSVLQSYEVTNGIPIFSLAQFNNQEYSG